MFYFIQSDPIFQSNRVTFSLKGTAITGGLNSILVASYYNTIDHDTRLYI